MTRHPLTAGAARALFAEGDLRYITVGDAEVVRRVYVAVRDASWGTIPPVLRDVRMEQNERGFHIEFFAEHVRAEIDFAWRGTIAGDAEEIRFEMDGEARSTFRTCRTGICVLHPITNLAGSKCVIEHVDGTTEAAQFPITIAPHQPFTDVAAIQQSGA